MATGPSRDPINSTHHKRQKQHLFATTNNMFILFLPALARLIEAFRDAEIFEHPLEDRSTVWHLLKFPQYGIWMCFGMKIEFSFEMVGIYALSLAIAYGVFELSLMWFRK